MTRNEARKAAEVMLAYADGKEIDNRRNGENTWNTASEPTFDWWKYKYRIKPQPKYRPFNSAEECWQEMQKHQPFGWIRWKKEPRNYQSLVLVEKGGVGCVIDEISMKFKESLDILTFADGSVFGVKEEEV